MPHLTFASHLVSSFAFKRPGSITTGGRGVSSSPATASQSSHTHASEHSVDRSEAVSQRELGRFALANKDLLHVIDQSDQAKELLKKKNIETRADLVSVVAEAAHSLLNYTAAKHVDRDFLKKNAAISSLIVLNTGGLRDTLNESEDDAKLLVKGAESIAQDTFDALAKKAQALFSESSGHPLDDEEFFANNPKAAVYVLTHTDIVRSFTSYSDGATQARSFKEQVNGAYQDTLESFTVEFAAQATRSGAFNEDFFEGEIEVAEFVAARELLSELPSAAQFLREHPEKGLGNTLDRFHVTEVISELTAFQAKAKISSDSSLDETFLTQQTGLSRLLLKKSELAKAFNSSESKKQLSYVLGNAVPDTPSMDVLNQLKKNFNYNYQNLKPTLSYLV